MSAKHPEMREVESSNIAAIGHSAAENALYVRFHSGDTWRYDGVDAATAQKLHEAESVGRHFHAHIKGKFDREKA